MTNEESPKTFDEIFTAELQVVRARRLPNGDARSNGLPYFSDPSPVLDDVLTELTQDRDSNSDWSDSGGFRHDGLVGLALSGGGVRSATFNLGVLQILNRYRIFEKLDYISSVSGGGYIASCLSSIFAQADQRQGRQELNFPFVHKMGQLESAPFQHLRDYSNYLAPGGTRDLLQMPALVLRGLIMNFLVIFSYILLAVLLTVTFNSNQAILGQPFGWEHRLLDWIPGDSFRPTKFLVGLFLALLIVYPGLQVLFDGLPNYRSSRWLARNIYGRVCGMFLAAIAIVTFIDLQPLAIQFIHNTHLMLQNIAMEIWQADEALLRQPQGLFTLAASVATVVSAILAGTFFNHESKSLRSLSLYLIGGLGFAAFWLVYLILCYWAIYSSGPQWIVDLERHAEIFVGISLDWIPTENDYLILIYAFIMTVLFLYTWLFYDANSVSLHNFYRDRLSKAYLFSWHGGDRLEHNDNQLLSTLNTDQAPYHLINTALNIHNAKSANRRGRNADLFLFSKLYIGGSLTGYRETEKIAPAGEEVDLGTAMAISGAAAAPNMGSNTFKPLVFLMTLLNIRLGFWLPNPGRPPEQNWFSRRINRVGPLFLIREMFGLLDEQSENVNLSDGGHIENLGIYELLRRECRLIIASDAECDPEFQFHGLANVIRLARIDMGIRITMTGLDQIRQGRQNHAIGKIEYKGNKVGKLIYLKASLPTTEIIPVADQGRRRGSCDKDVAEAPLSSRAKIKYDGGTYIAHYRDRHPAFPHETTADQFFDEEQFECYRALGYHVAMRVFGDATKS